LGKVTLPAYDSDAFNILLLLFLISIANVGSLSRIGGIPANVGLVHDFSRWRGRQHGL
jgi:hypothetical protein